MTMSVFDIFSVGIGPSSSHTVGPMKAARLFAMSLADCASAGDIVRLRIELFGSLGATGKGHGSPGAVMLGLAGISPDSADPDHCAALTAEIATSRSLRLLTGLEINFDSELDIVLHKRKSLPYHANGMRFAVEDAGGMELHSRIYYSVGGGQVVDDTAAAQGYLVEDAREIPYPFDSAVELLRHCDEQQCRISDIMRANEIALKPESEMRADLLNLWQVMQDCVARGIRAEGILPGGLKVKRRAKELHQKLLHMPETALSDPLSVLDWVNLYAIAVNEENAAGGRIVTAPTNGAAGIIPAVLHYYSRFLKAGDDGIINFFLTAAAIGILYKKNASISGAEVGCQGEVGSACSMAAGALAEAYGGTPRQVENAAEIAMEHNLGLTCDPIGGLVQVPCIERNAMAANKAITAARLAMRGDGSHYVSLDKVIKTMRDTGRDMKTKYKETARGGLAINVVEVPVNIIEC